LSLSTRRTGLELLAADFPEHVRLSEQLPENAEMKALVGTLKEHGPEGIIVKCKDSIYFEGKEPGIQSSRLRMPALILPRISSHRFPEVLGLGSRPVDVQVQQRALAGPERPSSVIQKNFTSATHLQDR
jgi:hypothetical protein